MLPAAPTHVLTVFPPDSPKSGLQLYVAVSESLSNVLVLSEKVINPFSGAGNLGQKTAACKRITSESN